MTPPPSSPALSRLWDWRHRLIPDSLFGRAALVLLAGLLLAQLAALVIYSLNRSDLANSLRAHLNADRVAAAFRLAAESPADTRGRLIQAQAEDGVHLSWDGGPAVNSDDRSGPAAELAEEVRQRLPGWDIRAAVQQPAPMRQPLHRHHHPDDEFSPPALAAGPPPGVLMPPLPDGSGAIRDNTDPALWARLSGWWPGQMNDGTDERKDERRKEGKGRRHSPPAALLLSGRPADGDWVNVMFWPRRPERLDRSRLVLPMLLSLTLVLGLSLLAVRRAARPLVDLAAAAHRLGRDVNAPPVAETGPREVRAAARAFNEMQTRLRRFIDDRTGMIAAISHDLRTPITRMRLRAEFMEDDDLRDKMLADLAEMEAMIRETLAFARDDAAREERRMFDFAALCRALSGESGLDWQGGPEHLEMTGGALSLKRAVANLMQNAKAYAGGGRVTLEQAEGQLRLLIDDSGPGLPEAELERVFAPFYRGESSRNRQTGGTGLGLAVARSAVRAHGGDIVLSNRAGGGLRVCLTLPV